MKLYIKRIFAFILAISVFLSCTVSVYAFPARLKDGTWIDKPWSEAGEEIWLTIQYGLCQIGVFFQNGADFKQWLKNTEAYQDLWDENGRLAKHVTIDTKTETIKYDKEIMSVLKSAADDYAKDNEPYFIVRIPSYKEVNVERFATKGQYLTICNLAKKYGLIGVNGLYMSDLSEILNGNYSYVNETGILTEESLLTDYVVAVYDDSWDRYKGGQRYKFDFPAGISVGYEAIEDGTITGTNIDYDYHFDFQPDYVSKHNGVVLDFGTPYYQYEYTRACLISRDGIRTRVFKSMNDFKNYSVGNRKVYYTKDYYDYEPDDLSASVDDLEKSVDELQKIIDELLKKIDDLTSESDIEDLLKQILDALKNQQGTGGGGSGSGGDVTVNVDLTETNGWLSKIYTKLSQVFDKISSISIPSMRDVVTAIEDLSQMLKRYLSEITGDLDDIKGQLEEMSEQEFEQKTGDFLDDTMAEFSEVGEKAKTKFPFSIPNDIKLLISKMSVSPPEEAGGGESGVYSVNMMSADDPGGGLITVAEGDPEDAPVISDTGAPIFYLPLVIESAGINEFVIVDMSGFEPISRFCRGLLTIWFILCLYNMTFKVLGLWGDLVD